MYIVVSQVLPKFDINFIINWLVAQGHSHQHIFSLSALSGYDPTDDLISLSLQKYLNFFNEAAQLSGDECLGLHIGCDVDVRDFGFIGHIMHNCPTVRDGWQALERYISIIYPQMVLCLEEEEITSTLDYNVLTFSSEYCRHDIDLSLASFVRFFRTYAGENWHPESVYFKYGQPSNIDEYIRYFDTEIYFNQPRTALVFPSEVLNITISSTSPELLQVMHEYAESILVKTNICNNLITKVYYLIAHMLGTGQCSSSVVASKVFMSHRSFNRELKRLGTSFRDIKLEVIEDIAKHSLAKTTASIFEIALNLGYAETTAFDRAFKNKTGITPSAYRKSVYRNMSD